MWPRGWHGVTAVNMADDPHTVAEEPHVVPIQDETRLSG